MEKFFNRLLAKLGNDGFSLALFGTKVADSEEFCKKSNTAGPIIADDHYYISSFDRFDFEEIENLCESHLSQIGDYGRGLRGNFCSSLFTTDYQWWRQNQS